MLYTNEYLETLPEDSFLRNNYVENQSALQELESLVASHLSKKRSGSSKSLNQTPKPKSAASSASTINITPLTASKTLRELELAGTSKPISLASIGLRPLSSSGEVGKRKWGRLDNVSSTASNYSYSLYQLSLILGKGFDAGDLTAIQSSLNSVEDDGSSLLTQDCAVVGKRLSPSPNPKHSHQPVSNVLTYKPKLKKSGSAKVGRQRKKIRFAKEAADQAEDAAHSMSASSDAYRYLLRIGLTHPDLPDTYNSFAKSLNMTDKRHVVEDSSPIKDLYESDSNNPALSRSQNFPFSEDEFEDDTTISSVGMDLDDVIRSHGSIMNDTDADTPSPVDRNLSTPDYIRDYLHRTLRDKSSSVTTTTDAESSTSSQDSLRVFCDESSSLDFTSNATIGNSNDPCSQPSNEGAHPHNQRSPLASVRGKLGKSSVQRSQTSSNIRTRLSEKLDKPGSMPSVAYNAPKRPHNL